MPFIAIALAVSVFLGGSATMAATPAGHAAINHVSSVWTDIEADYSNELGTEAESETAVETHGSLNIKFF